MDSDCIVTGNLSNAKLITEKQTFFSGHWINKKYLKKNKKELYEKYPTLVNSKTINAGVFGINKSSHSDILFQWIRMTTITIHNPEIRKYVVNWDEGSLLWAIQYTNNEHLIIDVNNYNCYTEFMGDTSLSGEDFNLFYEKPIVQITGYSSPSLFFKQILNTEIFVHHFSTCMRNNTKYWNRWS